MLKRLAKVRYNSTQARSSQMYFSREVDVLATSHQRQFGGALDDEDICVQYASIGTVCWPTIVSKELKEESNFNK